MLGAADMSRNFLVMMACLVVLGHKHVVGEVILRDMADFQNTLLKPLAAVLCPWKPLSSEESSQSEDKSTDENISSWCGTTEKIGGFCNAKCSSNVIGAYLICAREFKRDVQKFIDRVMKFLCKKNET